MPAAGVDGPFVYHPVGDPDRRDGPVSDCPLPLEAGRPRRIGHHRRPTPCPLCAPRPRAGRDRPLHLMLRPRHRRLQHRCRPHRHHPEGVGAATWMRKAGALRLAARNLTRASTPSAPRSESLPSIEEMRVWLAESNRKRPLALKACPGPRRGGNTRLVFAHFEMILFHPPAKES